MDAERHVDHESYGHQEGEGYDELVRLLGRNPAVETGEKRQIERADGEERVERQDGGIPQGAGRVEQTHRVRQDGLGGSVA